MTKVIGLDIGGTKIEGIVFDGKKIVKQLTIVTPKNLADFKYSIAELSKFLSVGEQITGVGVGTAGVVNPQKGVIVTSPNLKFVKNFNIRKFLQSLGYKAVVLDNDANCFTRAEAMLGKARGSKNIIGITLGTGIGSGLFINGHNYRGSHYSGGEVGQLLIENNTLEHHYQRAKAGNNFKLISGLLVVRLADLVNILDPDCVALGGSVSQLYHRKFLPNALKLMPKYFLNKKLKPKIYVSFMKSSGALGAALQLTK